MTRPPNFAEIIVHGPEAQAFLHSQFAADIKAITTGQWRYAAYCVPDGRVQALTMIARASDEHYCLLLPGDTAEGVHERLQRYRLRARCSITRHEVTIVDGDSTRAQHAVGRYRCDDFHWRVSQGPSEALPEALWSQQIALGIAWIVAATSERFLPQMLGYERLRAFSLRKGCFPGQEVVARTHFLGRVKRRLVHLTGTGGPKFGAPGSELRDLHNAVVGSLLATDPSGTAALAVINDATQIGTLVSTADSSLGANFVIDRDGNETISDGMLNGHYDPPVGA